MRTSVVLFLCDVCLFELGLVFPSAHLTSFGFVRWNVKDLFGPLNYFPFIRCIVNFVVFLYPTFVFLLKTG